MRIISRKRLKEFWEKHRRAEQPLRAWFHEAKTSRWKSFQDIKKTHPSADVRPANRVIFDIAGNHFRLVVKIHYNTGVVFVRYVGTHQDYGRINPDTI